MTHNTKQAGPPCQCRCGGTTRGGRYLPGHDAKHKKALCNEAVGGSKSAIADLCRFGWDKFLRASGDLADLVMKVKASIMPDSAANRPRDYAAAITTREQAAAQMHTLEWNWLNCEGDHAEREAHRLAFVKACKLVGRSLDGEFHRKNVPWSDERPTLLRQPGWTRRVAQ